MTVVSRAATRHLNTSACPHLKPGATQGVPETEAPYVPSTTKTRQRNKKTDAPTAPSKLDALCSRAAFTLDELVVELPTLEQRDCDAFVAHIFHPAQSVRLRVGANCLAGFIRLLAARVITGFEKAPASEADSGEKVSSARKQTLTPQLAAEVIGLAPADFVERFSSGLAKLRAHLPAAFQHATSHVPRMSSARAPGVVRVGRAPAQPLPWLSSAQARDFAHLTYSGPANTMQAREFVTAAFVLEDEVTSVFELLAAGSESLRAILLEHALVDDALLARWFNCGATSTPDAVAAGLPQLLWDRSSDTVSITPVSPVSLLSLLGSIAAAGARSERMVYGGSKPQNVSAYGLAVKAVPTLYASIPSLPMLPEAVLLDRVFVPRPLIGAVRPWCRSDVFAKLQGRPNRQIARVLIGFAREAVQALAAPLFQLRMLLETHSPLLRSRHHEALNSSDAAELLFATGRAEASHIDHLSDVLLSQAVKTQRDSALAAEWLRFLRMRIRAELEMTR